MLSIYWIFSNTYSRPPRSSSRTPKRSDGGLKSPLCSSDTSLQAAAALLYLTNRNLPKSVSHGKQVYFFDKRKCTTTHHPQYIFKSEYICVRKWQAGTRKMDVSARKIGEEKTQRRREEEEENILRQQKCFSRHVSNTCRTYFSKYSWHELLSSVILDDTFFLSDKLCAQIQILRNDNFATSYNIVGWSLHFTYNYLT